MKVARTLADLEGDEKVGRIHVGEAIALRGSLEPRRRAA